MWTDAKSREFVATEYPWFLNTFDNYSQPIQRADAIRYFVLAHFGGIYIDLDDVCFASFPSNSTYIQNASMPLVDNEALSLQPSLTVVWES